MRFAVICCALSLVVCCPAQTRAQLRLGAHVSHVAGLDEFFPMAGAFGFGGQLGFEGGSVPAGVYGSGTLVIPRGSSTNFASARGAVLLRVWLPTTVEPFLVAGFQYRTEGIAGIDEPSSGHIVGLGDPVSEGLV